MEQRSLVILLGTTASGKSALGVDLARKFGGIVISADSRQVYRGLDIGTGKMTKREMRDVPHHLLDVASPRSQYSVAHFVRDAQRVLETLEPGVPVFLVGGSPFYIKALTEPESFSRVPPHPARRRQLEKKSIRQLAERLIVLDAHRAASVDSHNKRRLIRALEIAEGRRKNMNTKSVHPPFFRILKLGLTLPRPALYRAIDERVEKRLKQGMIREVQRLHENGLSWKRMEELGLEYRYISRFLRGILNKTAMAVQLKNAIHHFAKRQMTWFKRDPSIHWIRSEREAHRLVAAFLRTEQRIPSKHVLLHPSAGEKK